MSKWKQKRKHWLDWHSRLKHQRKRKVYHGKRAIRNLYASPYIIRHREQREKTSITLMPPRVFSLIDNPEETMKFFKDFAEEIEKNEYGKHFHVDSESVESATVDALIYLIAILQNKLKNRVMRYSFSGSYPKNLGALRVYIESGFNEYVQSKAKRLPSSTEKMCIVDGKDNKPESAKKMCDFVIATLEKNKRQVQPLQKILIELMSNVFYHAYEKNSFMAKRWYMYAEHVDYYVRCVFVDTGQGIAKTVKKNYREKIRELITKYAPINIEPDDSKIIQSAFDGDFRTATNKKFRGNGLLSVKKNASSKLFERFEVLSGHGRCTIPTGGSSEEILAKNYSNNLYGTLYTFVVK